MSKKGQDNPNYRHGLSKTRIYRIYNHMKGRCLRPTDKNFPEYGGRGISICAEWLGNDGFLNFYNWAIKNGYSDDLTIERKDVNGDYCPENCCWTLLVKQATNRRDNNLIEYRGEVHCLSEWASIVGIQQSTLWRRIYESHWTIEQAFTIPSAYINGSKKIGVKQ